MYAGNGVTKKFPIPEGYDGSTVVFIMSNGNGYRMMQGEAYEIQDGNIIFNYAVPAGIEISFDLSDATEMIKTTSKNYVVIYANGTIEEVSEDPKLVLEEAKKLLIEAKKQTAEAAQALEDAQKYISKSLSSSTADLDGRLDGYAKIAQDAISEAANKTSETIKNEWAASLERLAIESKSIREDMTQLQNLRREIQDLYQEALKTIKETAVGYNKEFIENCENIRKIRPDLELYVLEIKKDLREEAGLILGDMQEKADEEIEYLRTLRKKFEDDFNTLNTKINNRWELINASRN